MIISTNGFIFNQNVEAVNGESGKSRFFCYKKEVSTQIINEKIDEIIAPIAEKYGQEIVDINVGRNSRGVLIKVTVGSKKGPMISDLTSIAKEFNKAAGLVPGDFNGGDYQLEVSSPGIDRDLSSYKDFLWNEGREVNILIKEGDENKRYEGLIISANKDSVIFEIEGKQKTLCIEEIVKAKLKIKF